MSPLTVLWFRRDLRLTDNPALQAALKKKTKLLPLFIWNPKEEAPWSPGAASRWWLAQSLRALRQDLEKHGSTLIIQKGSPQEVFRILLKTHRIEFVYWNRCYEPAAIARDKSLQLFLQKQGIEAQSFNASLLREPWELQTRSGTPYQVFTPFWKTLSSLLESAPAVSRIPATFPPPSHLTSVPLEDLQLEPRIPWDKGLRTTWRPGETGAQNALKSFLKTRVKDYATLRDFPDTLGTSRLSPHLHFGEISPWAVWRALEKSYPQGLSPRTPGALIFLKELVWREFAYHLLYHFPYTAETPLRESFQKFPWRNDSVFLKRWQRGETGYPIVDAGMRELWKTGWMHNRVRMIVASFLVKHGLVHWKEGAQWFWDTLVDADLASNTLGWQWTAGCGADAAPYFRIFNPILQGKKFDPQGNYLARWIPELQKISPSLRHEPWKHSLHSIAYPAPIVDHSFARQRALQAYARIRKSAHS